MSDPFDFEAGIKRYAVLGNPVAHSKSPRIHALFAAQCGILIYYQAIQVDPGGFGQAVHNFRAAGGSGANVTVPFKLEAFRLAERVSGRARIAGAVNTLSFGADGVIAGDNTDGAGLVADITINLAFALRGREVLVLGAGGAVRGVLGPLLEQQPARVIVANRTPDRAVEVQELFSQHGVVEALGYDRLAGRAVDAIINGTSASLEGEVPPLPDDVLRPGGLVYDLMYADTPTMFIRWGSDHGAGISRDGLGMLVEQAAESFFVWHAVRPKTAPVLQALRPGASPAPGTAG